MAVRKILKIPRDSSRCDALRSSDGSCRDLDLPRSSPHEASILAPKLLRPWEAFSANPLKALFFAKRSSLANVLFSPSRTLQYCESPEFLSTQKQCGYRRWVPLSVDGARSLEPIWPTHVRGKYHLEMGHLDGRETTATMDRSRRYASSTRHIVRSIRKFSSPQNSLRVIQRLFPRLAGMSPQGGLNETPIYRVRL
jgi:hypothetical protein